jgi:hypothetical protein
MEATMMQKRLNLRRATIIPTEVMSPYWQETMDLVAADLSPNGMYLISDAFPTVGEFIFCSFALSGEKSEYRMLSRVKRLNFHRRRTDRIRPGFGVEFLGVDDRLQTELVTSLRGLPPPIPSKNRDFIIPGPVLSTPKLTISIPRPTVPVPGPTLSVPNPTTLPVVSVPTPGISIPRPTWDYPIY